MTLPLAKMKLPLDKIKLPLDKMKLPFDKMKLPFDKMKLPFDGMKLPFDGMKLPFHEMKLPFIENPRITVIKIIAIAFVTIIYLFGGMLFAIGCDKYLLYSFYDKTDEDLEKKSNSQHMLETTLILAVIGVVSYLARNILQTIPFPLDGLYNFEYKKIKEVSNGNLILWILITFSIVLTNKIKIIRKRIITL